MFAKTKRVRLKGKAVSELNTAIHERDNNRCVICGKYVDRGEKFHHEPCGAGVKSDEIEKGVTLCKKCHYERHFGAVQEYKKKCEEYLRRVKNGNRV